MLFIVKSMCYIQIRQNLEMTNIYAN